MLNPSPTAGIPFAQLEESQCRKDLHGYGAKLVCCGKRTRGKKHLFCDDHESAHKPTPMRGKIIPAFNERIIKAGIKKRSGTGGTTCRI